MYPVATVYYRLISVGAFGSYCMHYTCCDFHLIYSVLYVLFLYSAREHYGLALYKSIIIIIIIISSGP